MNRIKEIKERHSAGYVTTYITPMEVITEYNNDVQYLLSKLEQAEKALEWYTDKDHYEMYEAMNVGLTNDVTYDGGNVALEALKAIRE